MFSKKFIIVVFTLTLCLNQASGWFGFKLKKHKNWAPKPSGGGGWGQPKPPAPKHHLKPVVQGIVGAVLSLFDHCKPGTNVPKWPIACAILPFKCCRKGHRPPTDPWPKPPPRWPPPTPDPPSTKPPTTKPPTTTQPTTTKLTTKAPTTTTKPYTKSKITTRRTMPTETGPHPTKSKITTRRTQSTPPGVTDPSMPCYPLEGGKVFGRSILEARHGDHHWTVRPIDPVDCEMNPEHECCRLTSTERPDPKPPTSPSTTMRTTTTECVVGRRLFGRFGGAVVGRMMGKNCPSPSKTHPTVRTRSTTPTNTNPTPSKHTPSDTTPTIRTTPSHHTPSKTTPTIRTTPSRHTPSRTTPSKTTPSPPSETTPSTTSENPMTPGPPTHTPRTPCPGKGSSPTPSPTPPTKRPKTTTKRHTPPTRPRTTPCSGTHCTTTTPRTPTNPPRPSPTPSTTPKPPSTTTPTPTTPSPTNPTTTPPTPSPTPPSTTTTSPTTTTFYTTPEHAITCVYPNSPLHHKTKDHSYQGRSSQFGRTVSTKVIMNPEFCRMHPNHICCNARTTPPLPPPTPTPTHTSTPTTAPPPTPSPTHTLLLQGRMDPSATPSSPVPPPDAKCEELDDFTKECTTRPDCEYVCDIKKCLQKNVYTPEPGQCDQRCYENCPCSMPTGVCTFNVHTNTCEKYFDLCSRIEWFDGACRRSQHGFKNPTAYPKIGYAYSGGVCENKQPGGHCDIEQTIMAVNMGQNDSYIYKDQYDIPYTPQYMAMGRDPYDLLKYDRSLSVKQYGFGKEVQGIYNVSVWGAGDKKGPHDQDERRKRGYFYDIPISRDGLYELILKMIDNIWKSPGSRCFNVFFNKVHLLVDMDIILHSGDQFVCTDWILNFKVENGGTLLKMKGYEDSVITDGSVELGFSYGFCDLKDENFHVTAFAVNKFTNVGGRAIMDDGPTPEECSVNRGNACACRSEGCQLSAITGDCLTLIACPRHSFKDWQCRRQHVYYSTGGALCNNLLPGGNCQIAETILAVNLNGADHTDSLGIYYQSDASVPYYDHFKVRKTAEAEECFGVREEDTPLYCSYVYTTTDKGVDSEHCLGYTFDLTENGFYELNIKMGEFKRDEPGDAGFSIKINEQLVLVDIDILSFAKKNHPIDLTFPFEVQKQGNVILMRGYTIMNVFKHVTLEFCLGNCLTKHMGYTVSAFSVVRFVAQS